MHRLLCLDGLRGLLALYVLIGHVAPFATLPGAVQSLVMHGGAAVDLFFALSGLVIVQALERQNAQTGPFLIARAARIFPVYLPVFGFAVLTQSLPCGFERMPWLAWNNPAHGICVSGWPRSWLPEIAAHLTMTHGLFPAGVLPDVWISVLGSAWSLSTEWQFYMLALLVRGRQRLIVVLLVLAGLGAAWRMIAPEDWQFSRAFLPNQAHYFALGVASAGVVLGEAGALGRFSIILGCTMLVGASYLSIGKMLPPLIWAACLAAQSGCVLWPAVVVRWVLRQPACLYLGALSYCIYLVNEPIHKVLGQPLATLADGDPLCFSVMWIAAATGLPIAVSALLHGVLEQPALAWGRARAAAHAACAVRHARSIKPGDETTA